MKAYNLHAVNRLQYEDVTIPECPEGWAIVKVKACGVCSSDIPRIFTNGTYHFPTIPGHEFSGIVYSVNSNKSEYKSLTGKHVGVFPLIPCRQCKQCENKKYELCNHYDYLGSRRDGGFAQFVAVPVWNLIPINANIAFEVAALMEPLSVALHAVKLFHLSPNNDFAVVGTGMIGLAAGLWAKNWGCSNVTILGRSENKRPLVESLNLNYKVLDSDDNNKYDSVLEAVGTSDTICSSLKIAAPEANIVLMGNPASDITLPKNIYWMILRKQLTIKGTWNSSFDGTNKSDWTEVAEFLETNPDCFNNLITHKFDSDDLMSALVLMKNHAETYCKVMTLWND